MKWVEPTLGMREVKIFTGKREGERPFWQPKLDDLFGLEEGGH